MVSEDLLQELQFWKGAMGEKIFQVDAFTDRPFSGNPAAVCILEAPREAGWMLDLAREMNLSETAFLRQKMGGFSLRWFTPRLEVDLCGHGTLAAAHILWEQGYTRAAEPVRFHTLSGPLSAERKDGWIELNFPMEKAEQAEPPPGLLEALHINAEFVGRNRLDYLVEVASPDILKGMAPDFEALEKIPARGVIVTARALAGPFDFFSRYFAPGSGIGEDAVTGSSHCCLAPFWQSRLGKRKFLAYQASGRGGVLRVRAADNRVILGGQAVTVFRGELL
jgi:PhzF family phenazine biosynthesis protein